MQIKVTGTPEEIAALALAVQERQSPKSSLTDFLEAANWVKSQYHAQQAHSAGSCDTPRAEH